MMSAATVHQSGMMSADTLGNNPTLGENSHSLNRNNDAVPISEDTVAAAGFNVENPILNALIGNIKGTLPVKKTANANAVKCDVCNCEMSSDVVMSFHLNGAKHKKKMKALEIVTQLKASGEKGLELGKEDDPNAFRCEICCLTVNSAQQLEIHITGTKHKNKAIKAGLLEPPSLPNTSAADNDIEDGAPPSKKKKKEEVTLYCDTCQITVNSQHQYDQHLLSKKHLNRLTPQKHSPNKGKGKPNMRFVNFKSGGKQIFGNTNLPNPHNGSHDGPLNPPQPNLNNHGTFNQPGNFINPANPGNVPTGNFNNPGNFKKPRNFNGSNEGPGNLNVQEDFKNPGRPMNKQGKFNRPPGPPGNFKMPRNPSGSGNFKNPGNFPPPPLMNDNYNGPGNFKNNNSNNNNKFNNDPNNRSKQNFNSQNHERMGPPKNKFPGQNNHSNNSNFNKKNMQNGVQKRKAPGKNQQFRNNHGNNQFNPFQKGDFLPPPPPPPPFPPPFC